MLDWPLQTPLRLREGKAGQSYLIPPLLPQFGLDASIIYEFFDDNGLVYT